MTCSKPYASGSVELFDAERWSATTKIGLANLVYNIKRLISLERRAAA